MAGGEQRDECRTQMGECEEDEDAGWILERTEERKEIRTGLRGSKGFKDVHVEKSCKKFVSAEYSARSKSCL